MDWQTKGLLIRSIEAYNKMDSIQQKESIEHIHKMFKQHKKNLEIWEESYAEYYPKAAEIFLRIFDKKNVNS